MNRLNLLPKLAVAGVASAAAATMLGVGSVQAAVVIGRAQFQSISDFAEAADLSSVTLSNTRNFVNGGYSGIFTDPPNASAPDGPCGVIGDMCLSTTYEIFSVADITLTRIGTTNEYTNPSIDNFKVYQNEFATFSFGKH